MRIVLSPTCRRGFIASVARLANQPISIKLEGEHLLVENMQPEDAALALAEGAFPCWLRSRIQYIVDSSLRCFSAQERRRTIAITCTMIEDDVYRGTAGSGPNRTRNLAQAMLPHLQEGTFDFNGFCRFALAGHDSYLRYMVELAADELLAAEECDEYIKLLQLTAGPHAWSKKGELTWQLFFSADHSCQIWQRDESGFRLLEGGCFYQREDMLLSNIISAAPAKLILSNARYAPLSVLETLEKVFESRLSYNDTPIEAGIEAGSFAKEQQERQ